MYIRISIVIIFAFFTNITANATSDETAIKSACRILPILDVPLQPGICLGLDFPILNCIKVFRLDLSKMAKINKDTIYGSGFSSGAFMISQMHYSFSKTIRGAGIFAGGPFLTAYNRTGSGTIFGGINLLSVPAGLNNPDITKLKEMTNRLGFERKIDHLVNIKNSQVYLFHGAVDPLVPLGYGHKNAQMYKDFGANVKSVFFLNATHTVPTKCQGDICQLFSTISDGLNICKYEGIFDMFSHFYGSNFNRPLPPNDCNDPTGNYYAFDQKPFVPIAFKESNAYMHGNGYIYIPKECQNPNAICHLHLALHGCLQQIYSIMTTNLYALKSGYTQVADINKIIIVFPVSAPAYVNLENTNWGCWDFFGGTSAEFPLKTAPQMQTVWNILATIARLPTTFP